MTIGRFIELYQAELAGKQIIKRTTILGYYHNKVQEYDEPIKLSELDLATLSELASLDNHPGKCFTYFIEGEDLSNFY